MAHTAKTKRLEKEDTLIGLGSIEFVLIWRHPETVVEFHEDGFWNAVEFETLTGAELETIQNMTVGQRYMTSENCEITRVQKL